MESLRCSDYGFTCKFIASGSHDVVINDFKNHMNNEHGIEYSNEAIKEIIKRKYVSDNSP